MKILHFNDEETKLHEYLEQRGHANVVVGADGDPWSIVRSRRFDAAFVGLHPHGMRLMRCLHQARADCFVTIITSDPDTRRAVEAIKAGAFDYLLSPLDFAEVERICIHMSRGEKRRREQRKLQDRLDAATGTPVLIGDSAAMSALGVLVGKAAASTAPVLISGETGTGKGLVARLLHETSSRRDKPFVSINCNAIPSALLESELFGYRKGAFTGADTNRQGLLAQAEGGTFLFDEISDLEPGLQGKILRVLEEGEVLPLGERKVQRLDVRFVAATNRDLNEMVRQDRFRDDLYFRLNVVPIDVPPLRQRMEDVIPLVRHFIEHYCREDGRQPLKISPSVWRRLSQHHWPGNVRELENVCRRAVALTEDHAFDTDVLDLSGSFARGGSADRTGHGSHGLHAARRNAEKVMIEQALTDGHGNVSAAARSLGISRTTFYAKMRQMGVAVSRTI